MPYDPNFPVIDAEMTADGFREQFAGLKSQIDAVTAGPPGPAGPPGAQGPAGPPGQGLVMQGDWLDYQTYAPGDVVAYNSQTYVALTSAVGTPPDQAGNWRLLSITGPAGAAGEVSLYQLNEALRTQAARNVDAV